jgi:DNA/RNA-binding domain of Phe-tRNA-synthetase-like protein
VASNHVAQPQHLDTNFFNEYAFFMQFRIDDAIFQKYPNLLVGLLVCKDVKNGSAPTEVTTMLRDAEKALQAKFADPEVLKMHPTIAAWQEVHRSFGSNPNKFPSSVHALAKRVAKGSSLPSINTLVDLYNIISLRHMLPAGGEDLDACRGDIVLAFATGSESFIPLGSSENEPPETGEVMYRDDEGVICRKFNWREGARTALTDQTQNAVLVIEAVPPTQRTDLEAALQELQELVMKFCGGVMEKAILERGGIHHVDCYDGYPKI